ncbi:RT0821/Lpp0805 family surface protein [Aeromonas schubertii]|uniref:RT0821/Lpp0805 family surface protein n=1 Tax=Aeromonas TaxID=642 RepID=UPI0009EC91EC|nr:RT0821/Lpp0805 family surface protein [Aeromonas schubertii]
MMRTLIPLLTLWLAACANQNQPPLYQEMNEADVRLANQTLQQALQERSKGETLTWSNVENRHFGSITPLRTFRQQSGLYCRDYREDLYIGTRHQTWQDTACRHHSGRWLPLRG